MTTNEIKLNWKCSQCGYKEDFMSDYYFKLNNQHEVELKKARKQTLEEVLKLLNPEDRWKKDWILFQEEARVTKFKNICGIIEVKIKEVE